MKKKSHEDTELRKVKDGESEEIERDTLQEQKIKFCRILDSNSHEHTDKTKHLSAYLISDCKNHQLIFEENSSFSSSLEKKSDDDAEVRTRAETTTTTAISY